MRAIQAMPSGEFITLLPVPEAAAATKRGSARQVRDGRDCVVAAYLGDRAERRVQCGPQSWCFNAEDERGSASIPPARRAAGGLPRSSRRPVLGEQERACLVSRQGRVEQDEDLLHAAHREFSEETGLTSVAPTTPLAPVRQPSGKLVYVWAIETDIDPSTFQSNSFPLEWPPRSGQVRQFPEVDRVAWFDLAEARIKIHKGQVAFLSDLLRKFGG